MMLARRLMHALDAPDQVRTWAKPSPAPAPLASIAQAERRGVTGVPGPHTPKDQLSGWQLAGRALGMISLDVCGNVRRLGHEAVRDLWPPLQLSPALHSSPLDCTSG